MRQNAKLHLGRIRTLDVSCEKIAISERGGAESDTLAAENSPVDPDLQSIIEQWEDLSEATKAHVVAMVRAANVPPTLEKSE